MRSTTNLLIIGAGPYGLAIAAEATHRGLEHLIVGAPMSFWRANMPAGMFLRSASDWHLDPRNRSTIEAYIASLGQTPEDIEPLSLEFYLGYTDWFLREQHIRPLAAWITRLDREDDGRFRASLASGDQIIASRVVIALGFSAFQHVPSDVANVLPNGSFGHTSDDVELDRYAGKRILIVGGRQSAYEWAALLADAGAPEVHLSHRHPAPAFAKADWSWVTPLVDAMIDDPGWYRRLAPTEQQVIIDRMYAEGRLKVEPWLKARVERAGITVHANTRIDRSAADPNGGYGITFDDGTEISVDRIILATGYKVDVGRIPLLANGNLLPRIDVVDGYPVLDESFGTSVPGLYITSMPATRDFGPFFGFTIAVRASSRVIGQALVHTSS